MNWGFIIACLLGLSHVALSAYTDHSLQNLLSPEDFISWNTGLRYHQIYTIVILVLSCLKWLPDSDHHFVGLNAILGIFIFSIILFSGGIYLYILTGNPNLAMIIPIGGTLLMISWIFTTTMAITRWKIKRK